MAPVKFDDIPKVANEVLNDDYQVSGYVFKAKQKTGWDGAVLSTQVDFQDKDKGVATPAKLAWKFPKPFGYAGLCIDKLEMDKGGKYKLEASSDKVYPGLKVECKSDLVDVLTSVGCTYTGLKDMQFKFECKPKNPKDGAMEASYTKGIATCGLKFPHLLNAGPHIGLRLLSGPFFGSFQLLAGGPSSASCWESVAATAHYKANADLRCAAACSYSAKSGGVPVTLGCTYKGCYKVKAAGSASAGFESISCSAKHVVAKGFTLLGGAQYSAKKGSFSYGLQLSIE